MRGDQAPAPKTREQVQPPQPKEEKVREKTCDDLKEFEVYGAGTEAANGVYKKTDERQRGKPVWRKEGTNAYIIWWDEDCGFELYSNGPTGTCSYWTEGGVGSTPVNSTWSVRGDQAPAPKIREQVQPPQPEEEKVPEKTCDDLMEIEVYGAGTETANGVYKKTDETEKGKPVWRKEGTNAYIIWWSNSCGFELYSDGPTGTCSYWTKGGVGSTPVNSTWSVRGDQAPAPNVKEVIKA